MSVTSYQQTAKIVKLIDSCKTNKAMQKIKRLPDVNIPVNKKIGYIVEHTYTSVHGNKGVGGELLTGTIEITLLQRACEEGDLPLIKLLVEKGACINGHQRVHPLYFPMARGEKEIVDYLFEKGAKPSDQQLLNFAAKHGWTDIGRKLIKGGSSPSASASMIPRPYDARLEDDTTTPIAAAASNQHIEFIKMLIEHRCDVNGRDTYNGTALHIASSTNQIALAKLLLENGASILDKDYQGYTPRAVANSKEMKKLFKSYEPKRCWPF